jgi:serine phosphatase RsbU (regulator of sigma subunit)
MSRDEFNALIELYPILSKSMVRVLSNRLDSTNFATFRDLTEKNRQLQKAYDELKAAQQELIEKKRLERELEVAADIQISILPDVLPLPPGFDFGARIDPARQVGGDFYDVFRISDNKVGVLIGDVADKGVPAAIFMARAHALIVAEAESFDNPGDVLRKANAHITRLEKTTQFVTVLYGILNIDNGEFTYARAGHEPPLLLHVDSTVKRLPFETGMALGLWENITLDEQTIILPKGFTLVMYTDGMTDCRDPEGQPFALEGIQRALSICPTSSAQVVCDHLLKTLVDYQQGSKQDDDVTLVAVHAQ